MEIDYRDFCYFFSGWDTFLVRKAIDEKIRWPPGLIERVNKERWKRGRRRTLHYGFDEQLRQNIIEMSMQSIIPRVTSTKSHRVRYRLPIDL